LKSAFKKISRVRSLTGGTSWYLSKDCLLAAKRMMYVVEYRRFYLRDLESIVVWPSRSWRLRMIIPGVLFIALGAGLWQWANSIAGEIFTGIGVIWLLLELALGPTAGSRIRATGVSIDMPLVSRTRRAPKVLNKIDAALRASRGVAMQPAVVSTQMNPEAATAAPSIADGSETNGL
jgi:hypothetical protein